MRATLRERLQGVFEVLCRRDPQRPRSFKFRGRVYTTPPLTLAQWDMTMALLRWPWVELRGDGGRRAMATLVETGLSPEAAAEIVRMTWRLTYHRDFQEEDPP